APALRRAQPVAVQVQQNGEQPGANRAGGAEQTPPGNGTFETILHQIIGQIGVARQRPGITPESRHAGFELAEKLIHGRSRAYSMARCQTPPTPSPLISPAAMSSYQ